ncbi:MAG: 2-oxoglutarate dehydrogenase E1 component [Chloroflexi bacterium ADurb.Bin325]|nr:MAG: 2-oxoglutarate dehydrogenase E1 component [Chloroflexi bacterium ADurb.Bin325]
MIGGPVAGQAADARAAIQALRDIYQGTLGHDYDHIRLADARAWLRETVEAGRCRPPTDPINPLGLLERLTEVEAFEQFLGRAYPGKTRFSIEGLDMLVPILDEIVGQAAEEGVPNILIGMAHRGRLNVLAHVLCKPYEEILAEFKDPLEGQEFWVREDLGWTGDVKYHKGARRALEGGDQVRVSVSMIANPSHLEYVNPVVEGMARAAISRVDAPGAPEIDVSACLPILIHGDAAFAGQGIVAETLNFSNVPGYHSGGSIHIIANNQIGFTAVQPDVGSMLYVSDLAKGFKIPIVHVNADDPEACIEAARIAYQYTARFERDFLIDLVGYRRHGHNEGDDPTFTQPVMYDAVAAHPTVRSLWAEELARREVVTPAQADALVQDRLAALQRIAEALEASEHIGDEPPVTPTPGAARRVRTAVPAETLREMGAALTAAPDGFQLNPRLARLLERRRKALQETDADAPPALDWGTAEALALASILADGVPIRLTGEDVQRGTFSQRHAVYFDARTGEPYTPLQALPQARAAFEIHNTPLTEGGIVGFEYGYSIHDPSRLVIWEAQYGDFVNGAQVIIDEYLTSGRAKWGHTPSLVMLLPHGYEGQGPDHSSARPERFLQATAETNLRIAYPTTAAQYFHLLRRQAALLGEDPLPLIVLAPKSLLRHPLSASRLTDLAEGAWQPVLDDPQAAKPEVQRLVICSGKVYVDLATSKHRTEDPFGRAVGLVRVEQLYVFPAARLSATLDSYPNLREVVWLQEEPENMGAWDYIRPRLTNLIAGRWPLRYIGRPRASSPAEGSAAWHAANQAKIVAAAFARPNE